MKVKLQSDDDVLGTGFGRRERHEKNTVHIEINQT